MRTFGVSAAAILVVGMLAVVVYAMQHEATADKGRMLFNDTKLGTNGKSCNDCHKDGAGLEKAGVRKDLETMVNACITKALNGKSLKTSSAEMQSLVLYIKGLGSEKKPSGKKVRSDVEMAVGISRQ
jgi:cytochrome c